MWGVVLGSAFRTLRWLLRQALRRRRVGSSWACCRSAPLASSSSGCPVSSSARYATSPSPRGGGSGGRPCSARWPRPWCSPLSPVWAKASPTAGPRSLRSQLLGPPCGGSPGGLASVRGSEAQAVAYGPRTGP